MNSKVFNDKEHIFVDQVLIIFLKLTIVEFEKAFFR